MGLTSKTALEPSAELLTWDSEWWGVRVGRSASLMDEWAVENTVGCMWMLIPASDQEDVHRAEQGGARVMDVRVTLERDTAPRDARILAATPADLDWMLPLAREAFRGLTRFYADPDLPDERCDDLYANWIIDSLDGWAHAILTHPDGFITVHATGQTASIGLIAVDAKARGTGVGRHLTDAAVNWAHAAGYRTITVVTQGCNIPAQRTFQACGFRTSQTDVWLHKWYG